MEFSVFGPIEVVDGGRPLALGGPKQRTLLAALLVHANEVVSAERLIDALWDDQPPETAQAALQVHVSQLRKVLGRDRIVTRAPGYLLRVEVGEFDLERFEHLVCDPRAAGANLREGLALWRGPPFAEFAQQPFARAEITRLGELRLAAEERRIADDLALGRHAAIVSKLEALVQAHPYREPLRGQLMLALYRSGRQAEALEAYRSARATLVEELGIEPGPELRRLERAILDQDPELEIVQPDAAAAPKRSTPTVGDARVPLHRRPLVIGALAGVLAAAVAIPVFALGRGSGGNVPALARIQDNAVGVVDAQSRTIVDEAPEIASPQRIAAGEGSIWVTSSSGGGSVVRLDSDTHDVTDTIEVGNGPVGIAVGAGAVWVANTLDGTVSRIDPAIDRVVSTIEVGNTPTGVAFGLGAVWVTNADDRSVSKIDPVTNEAGPPIDVGAAARWIAIGGGAVWVTDPVGNAVVRVDGRSDKVTDRITLGSGPAALAFGYGAVWVTNSLDGTLSRVDARRAIVTDTITVGAAPNGVAVTPDGVWLTNEVGGTLVHVDQASRGTTTTTLGGRPEGITGAGDSLWIAVQAAGAAHHGGIVRMLAEPSTESIDPARNYTGWSLLSLVYDGLVGFKRVGGADGNTPVPDLASALPTPTDSGRTYTFRLRKGIRFSDGSALTASAVRYSFERLFRASPARPDYYEGIVGGRACKKHPQRCDLSDGISTDDENGIITIRLRAPDPEFLYKLALPFASVVPIGTAAKGESPVIGTGPYRIAEHSSKGGMRLLRNRYFEVWSGAAQPEGVPDEVRLVVTGTPEAQFAAVQQGRADIGQGVPANRRQEARTRNAAQFHVTPAAWTFSLVLNSTRPPFDDPRVRRAVAYAVDRGLLVESLGGTHDAASTCQLLPPNFPAYDPYCPYTSSPTAGGAWTAPDLERARRLVAESGTKGMRVDVMGLAGNDLLPAMTTALARTLRDLGYDTSVRRATRIDAYFDALRTGGASVEASVVGWGLDYPAPGNYISGVLACGRTPFSCSAAVEQKLRKLRELQARDPQAATEAWTRLDRELVDQAIVIPVITGKAIDFVSKRVRNYQRHPVLGILLSQLWVR